MSVLVHQCRTCGHDVVWHEPRETGYTRCGCCRAGRPDRDPEPTLRETTTWRSEPEPLWEPGALRNAGTMHAIRLCDCDRCRQASRTAR